MSVVLLRIPSWWKRRAAHPENVMAPLDLGYAASLLEQRDIPVHLLDVEALHIDAGEVERRLRAWDPEHVVLHAATPAIPLALEVATRARATLPRLRCVVLVGQHATALPHTVLGNDSPIDVCIRGEFERALAALVDGGPTSSPGLVTPDTRGRSSNDEVLEIHDLDALPPPSHERFRHGAYRVFHPTGVRRRWRWGFLLSSRGCPYRCTYCSPTLRNSFGNRFRFRSTESVLNEMALLRSLGFTILHFKDDLFTQHAGRVRELCEAIERRGWQQPWTAQTRPDRVDLPLLHQMRRAGCRTIGFGVESGSPEVLERLNKGHSVAQVRDAFRWARSAGLRTVGFFMLGNPDETEADIRRTHRLMLELAPDIIQVAFFTPYPGSEAYGLTAPSEAGFRDFSHYNSPINLSRVDDATLRDWQRRFYLDLLLRTGFLWRYFRGETLPILRNLDRYLGFARLSASFLLRRFR